MGKKIMLQGTASIFSNYIKLVLFIAVITVNPSCISKIVTDPLSILKFQWYFELDNIISNNDNRTILICSHGGTIRNIKSYRFALFLLHL